MPVTLHDHIDYFPEPCNYNQGLKNAAARNFIVSVDYKIEAIIKHDEYVELTATGQSYGQIQITTNSQDPGVLQAIESASW